MTQTLIFHNPGEIDIRGAHVAGLSAKETDSAIGYFGTGLKYAIACILRWRGTVTIYAGTTRYEFGAKELEFRGKNFSQVEMNGQPLGFTTEYGKDWQPWEVFRELYANARDEGGGVRLEPATLRDLSPRTGETLILVSGVPELISAYYERDDIILPADKTFQLGDEHVQINKSPSSWLYYRGVRVHKEEALFTYNFLQGLQLTENRSLANDWPSACAVRFYLSKCTDKQFIETMLRLTARNVIHKESFERGVMSYFGLADSASYYTDEFCEVVSELYRQAPTRYEHFRKLALDFKPELAALHTYTLSKREEAMLARAKELVSLFGFKAEVESLPIVVEQLGGDVLGLWKDGEIKLSPNLFEQGTKQLVSTLYEECTHARTGYSDCSYTMQTHLFNTIISLNEDLHGVIC